MFTKLRKLEELYLSNNQIQELQPDVFIKQPNYMDTELSYLKILDLRNNQISVMQPKTFKNSINLEKLFLSNNPIVSTLKQYKGITGLGLYKNVKLYIYRLFYFKLIKIKFLNLI
jgi:Leucine-rich repeat (LRR) protein